MTISWELQQLADWYGVETSFYDDRGNRCDATPEALLTILGVLGAPLRRVEDAGNALRQRRQELWQRVLEPVSVAWDGWAGDVTVKLPTRTASTGTLVCTLEIEDGEPRAWSVPTADLPVRETAEVEGAAYTVRALPLPGPLPSGYHRLRVDRDQDRWESLIISAPTKGYEPPQGAARSWGVFLPTYAIRSARNWGAGDFTDLENLFTWVQGMGGGMVGTLPLLAAFLDEPFEFSPYSPASRMMWNEFYLDVQRAPEFAACSEAQTFVKSPAFQRARDTAQKTALIDYRPLMDTKRRTLEMLARKLSADSSPRRRAVEELAQQDPRIDDYARFRAVGERLQKGWWTWPERQRGGVLQADDYDESARFYHVYVQFLAREQLASVAKVAGRTGTGLYLDLPLGVNPDSYDVWRERDVFALGISGGAPPDSFFSKGQDWGFPPIHPENLRAQGYRYLRDCLRHHMELAGMLRIDHIMGLHRLYWVPRELGAKQGVYVRYPSEELYAVYTLESNRHRTVLVGEDLGTVPPQVRPAMARHEVRRLYVAQYEARPDANRPFTEAPPGSVASLNTHDMPTFTAFWRGLDIRDRKEMGLLDDAGVREEQDRRQAIRMAIIQMLRKTGLLTGAVTEQAIQRGCLQLLASDATGFVMANLEDIWQATEPQNVPGTWREKPNWRRRAVHPLEDFDRVPGLRETLTALNEAIVKSSGVRH